MPLGFLKNLVAKFGGRAVDWDELEETLLRADLGVPMTMRILDALKERGSQVDAETAADVCRQEILEVLPFAVPPIGPLPAKPKAILIVGVNGTGKTTSAAKMAHWFKTNRYTSLLVAADTFRAAAIEQLQAWGQRIGVEVVSGQYGGDPAALCYDAWSSAYRRNTEFLICDTAGRLHTKGNLMQELAKVKCTLQTRPGSSARIPARRRRDNRFQRPGSGQGVSRSDRTHRNHFDETGRERQGRCRRGYSTGTRNPDEIRRNRGKARRLLGF
jgi:fused signal recognition particle receptor